MIFIRVLQATLSITILVQAVKSEQYIFLIPGIALLYLSYKPLCSCYDGTCRRRKSSAAAISETRYNKIQSKP